MLRASLSESLVLALRLELVRAYQAAEDYLLVIMCL